MQEESLSSSFSVANSLSHAGPVELIVLFLLVAFSLATWVVIFERWRTLKRLYVRSEGFLKHFWDAHSLSELHVRAKDIEYSPAREIFRSGYNEMVRVIQARDKRSATAVGPVPFDTVKRSLSKARFIEEGELAKNMGFLAVCASATPFIGLFGTVVGIIRAFHDIGSTGSASLATVAPGISEALIATALGLGAAIPAVIFYNMLSGQARRHLMLLDGFSADFLNILERHFNIGGRESHSQAHAD